MSSQGKLPNNISTPLIPNKGKYHNSETCRAKIIKLIKNDTKAREIILAKTTSNP
jgi:hypothetical protein